MVTIDNNPLHVNAASAAIAEAGLGDRVAVRLGNAVDELDRLAADR